RRRSVCRSARHCSPNWHRSKSSSWRRRWRCSWVSPRSPWRSARRRRACPSPSCRRPKCEQTGAACVAAPAAPYARAMNELEEGTELRLDFRKLTKIAAAGCDVVPVAVQHADSGEVLLIAYVNEEALRAAIARRTAIFWSTSRNALWVKGETSGETFE